MNESVTGSRGGQDYEYGLDVWVRYEITECRALYLSLIIKNDWIDMTGNKKFDRLMYESKPADVE